MKTIMPLSSNSDDDSVFKLPTQSDEDIEELLAKTNKLLKDKEEATDVITELDKQPVGKNPAADLVRNKLNALYEDAPAAKETIIEAEAAGSGRSKHQEFIYKLNNSGKSVAEVQVEWHEYYNALPDKEKHEIWKEFYEEQSAIKKARADAQQKKKAEPKPAPKPTILPSAAPKINHARQLMRQPRNDSRSMADIKRDIALKAAKKGKLSTKQHLKSLGFGLGIGLATIALVSFSFFNERFIAPFISPSRNVSATPIIGSSGAIGSEPAILIPKINLEVPVVYDTGTYEEKAVQAALERGVVHYHTTPMPGEQGNVVVVGHSSNNILNKGKYKFAFVMLNRMETGDIFYLQQDGIRYTYQVFENRIVPPTDISVLSTSSRPNTATLITCDPPGTSINRRIVVGEQISPDPSGNKQSSVATQSNPEILPSNAPSLWSRLFGN